MPFSCRCPKHDARLRMFERFDSREGALLSLLDEGAVNLNRQDDWFVPAFREFGGMLVRGVSVKQHCLYWYGNE